MFRDVGLRTRQLRAVWKPKSIGWFLTIWGVWRAAKSLRDKTGPFNNLILAICALTLVILYTIPNKSVQLLPKRIVAFLIDCVLLAVLSMGIMIPLYEYDVVEPSAIVSMGIAWAWFFAFVVADWKLGGTPGQLILGLRLKSVSKGNTHLDFVSSMSRNLLTVFVPVVVGGRLLLIPLGYSQTEQVLRLGAGFAVLVFLPTSIAFSGGHTLSDLLLHVTVLPKRSGISQYPPSLNKQHWALLIIASATMGGLLALTQNLESALAAKPPTFPELSTTRNDPSASAWIWTRLQRGLHQPDFFIQHVEAFSEAGGLSPEIYTALDNTPCANARKSSALPLLVEAQLRVLTPATFRFLLYDNLSQIMVDRATYNRLPAFLLFDEVTDEDFAVFGLNSVESAAFCLSEANGKPESRFIMTGESAEVTWGISGLSLLALGELDTYAYIHRLPVWSNSE